MRKDYTQKSGFFGIGIENAKNEYNIGTLWRSAYLMGASFIFTVNTRYKKTKVQTRLNLGQKFLCIIIKIWMIY